jgi:transcriptional regulator with XRE-family HTH domain
VSNRQQKSEENSKPAARLRKARQLLRLTQAQLAQKWGFKDGNYIWMLEAGEKPFPNKLESKLIELENEVRLTLYPAHLSGAGQNPHEMALMIEEDDLPKTPKEHGGPYWGTTTKAPIVSPGSGGSGP